MEKFTLYLGLNDKDTKQQKIDTIEAYKIVENIITEKFDGGTISHATGVYKHDDGTIVREETLRIELLFTTHEAVVKLCNMLKIIFNQESIALQQDVINSELI